MFGWNVHIIAAEMSTSFGSNDLSVHSNVLSIQSNVLSIHSNDLSINPLKCPMPQQRGLGDNDNVVGEVVDVGEKQNRYQDSALTEELLISQDRVSCPYARGGNASPRPPPLHLPAGQIISKWCNFSPETEFTSLILASKSEFSWDSHPIWKNFKFAPLFQKSAYGPGSDCSSSTGNLCKELLRNAWIPCRMEPFISYEYKFKANGIVVNLIKYVLEEKKKVKSNLFVYPR